MLQACGHAAEDISNYKELFPSIFTARALTNCDMFILSAEEFHQVVEEYPKVKVKLHAWAVRCAAALQGMAVHQFKCIHVGRMAVSHPATIHLMQRVCRSMQG